MSKFIFAVLKKKSILVPNGDKTKYVIISGCPIEAVNGIYYLMDPITINDRTYSNCLTNGIYMFEVGDYPWCSYGYLYELSNLILKRKFHYVSYWVNSETAASVPEMKIEIFGFNTGPYY